MVKNTKYFPLTKIYQTYQSVEAKMLRQLIHFKLLYGIIFVKIGAE